MTRMTTSTFTQEDDFFFSCSCAADEAGFGADVSCSAGKGSAEGAGGVSTESGAGDSSTGGSGDVSERIDCFCVMNSFSVNTPFLRH